jgi:flagellum-specific ATP synthase
MKVKSLEGYKKEISQMIPFEIYGYVTKLIGLTIESTGPFLKVGDLCKIEGQNTSLIAEVIGFKDNKLLLTALGDIKGIEVGAKVFPIGSSYAPVGEDFLGRIVNALGEPLDSKRKPKISDFYPLYGEPLKPLERAPIKEILDVGIKAINALLTIGRGQRVAIMAGSGIGKSTLLGMIARYTNADVNVIALIGERGREVREFIERDLKEEGLKKSVVVVATSDEAPSIRIRAAYYATSLAEYFRDKGYKVLLLMDSLTRFCMAGREIGLASGEPPTARGYTPSVFAILPKLLERAGSKIGAGDITGIYNVLVEGDDLNDPIADSVRSIVDGHIVLSRDLAHEGHYPPIDILASISRVMRDIVPSEHLDLAYQTIAVLATYKKAEDLINIGAYVKGSNPEIDRALSLIGELKNFLKQPVEEKYPLEDSVNLLREIINKKL